MTSITAERAGLAAVGLRLRRREQWGAVFDYTNARAVDEPAVHQFVHISVTNPAAYISHDAHTRAIERIGISRFPNTGISYNRLVLPGGRTYEGQPIGRRGAHTVNDDQASTCVTAGCPSMGRSLDAPSWNLNVNGRAYVFARNVDDPITAADVDAMARCLVADRLAGFVTINATLHGHRCCSAKDCPGGIAWAHMGEINSLMRAYLARGNVTEDDMGTIDDTAANRDVIETAVMQAFNRSDAWRPDSGAQEVAVAEGYGAGNRSLRFVAEATMAQAGQGSAITLSAEQVTALAAAIGGELVDHVADAVADKLAARLQA